MDIDWNKKMDMNHFSYLEARARARRRMQNGRSPKFSLLPIILGDE